MRIQWASSMLSLLPAQQPPPKANQSVASLSAYSMRIVVSAMMTRNTIDIR